MRKILLLCFVLSFFGCSFNNSPGLSSSNTSTPFDYRDFAMGSFKVNISRSYPLISPNYNNYTPVKELNLTVYRSTYADDELIIKGIHGKCIYAYMNGNRFSFSSVETSLRPENLGFTITPYCPSCKIYISGSGSVSELERDMEGSNFQITVELNYDGIDLVRYRGSKQLDLPRPILEANDC